MADQNIRPAPVDGKPVYCECGCESELKAATQRNKTPGGLILPGQFRRFANGHQNRIPLYEVPAYLLSRSKSEGDCLVWTGHRDPHGYGSMMFIGERRRIHVIAWILEHGQDSRPLHVLHRCDNPPCFRIEHLFLGTALENIRDAKKKGRSAIGERHGMAKLQSHDVEEIRRLVASGMTHLSIAGIFGVGRQCVSKIVCGSRWMHMPESKSTS